MGLCEIISLIILLVVSVCLHSAASFQPMEPKLVYSTRTTCGALEMTSSSTDAEIHPAVAGWPDKYNGATGAASGPRVLDTKFAVEKATPELMAELDVTNWPTWTTGDKEKWAVGYQNADKVMPYGELSYMISGKLEIIPQATGEPVYIEAGEFVTFPEGFKSSWKVLEEVTWHYYLY